MPDDFKYSVFLSHSAEYKPIVRPIAKRLRKDGLHVRLDDTPVKGSLIWFLYITASGGREGHVQRSTPQHLALW